MDSLSFVTEVSVNLAEGEDMEQAPNHDGHKLLHSLFRKPEK